MAENTITSQGLMGLPHFKSSRVSREMYEPVYQNLFTVEIQLPTKLAAAAEGGSGVSTEDKNLLLEGVKKVSGLDTNKVPGAVTQNYKFAERSFAQSGTNDTHIDVKLDFEINLRGSSTGAPSMYTFKILRMWNDLIWDPLTGRQGLKVDYTAPLMTVTMHDKIGQPFWQWNCYNVFPITNLTAPEPDYSNKSTLYSVSGYTLRCDWWDEVIL